MMEPTPPTTTHLRGGFTLVEILIVVLILAILAAIALPRFAEATTGASQSAFAADLANYNKAAQLYIAEQGQLLPDGNSGDVPAGFEEYVNTDAWTRGPSIGGSWDTENGTFGVSCAFGVHFQTPADNVGDAFMLGVDEMIDDGNLLTGMFRKLDPDRYYIVVAR